MILFCLLLTTTVFIRFFFQIGVTRMGILPIACIVALFFGSGIQSSHKSGIKQYLDIHLQSFSRILINISFQIILSLYNISRTLSSIILLSINATLLGIIYFGKTKEWQSPLRAGIIFNITIYIISGIYLSYLSNDINVIVNLVGMILALLGAFWTVYLFIVGYFLPDILKDTDIRYEILLIYHFLIIVVVFKLYLASDPFVGLILIQLYIGIALLLISNIKQSLIGIGTNVSDMDVEYILRGYRINQIPIHQKGWKNRILHPKVQEYITNIPEYIYTALSFSSILTSFIFCGMILYFGQANVLYLTDFIMYLLNTTLYLFIFYLGKKIGIQDKLGRFFGFVVINICYFIVVAQVFRQDTISILFWSILRAIANNLALNYIQELKLYFGKSDYQYRLMSNFFGLIIISYFILTLPLDILLKVAIVVMMLGLRLLMNKDNIKSIMGKSN